VNRDFFIGQAPSAEVKPNRKPLVQNGPDSWAGTTLAEAAQVNLGSVIKYELGRPVRLPTLLRIE